MIVNRGPRRTLALAALASLASSALLSTLSPRAARADDAAPTSDAASADHTPITLDFSAYLGGSVRLGSAPSLTITDRTGLSAGGGLALAPSRSFAIAIEYEHVDLGAERLGGAGVGSAEVQRDAHALWIDARVHPLRRASFSIYADVGLGLAWQSAAASFVVGAPLSDGSRSVSLVRCYASAPANVALRAKAGFEIPIVGDLLFIGDASLENARLSGELQDGCISGAGTTSLFALRAGLGARLDLSALFRR